MISILYAVSTKGSRTLMSFTYRVVKFMVKVKLVEKRAKRSVGKVIVEKVMIQMSKPGIALAIANTTCPSKASHEVGSTVFPGTVSADGVAVVLAAIEVVLRREVKLCEAVDRLP